MSWFFPDLSCILHYSISIVLLLLDFLVVDQLHILYASLLLLFSTIRTVLHTIHHGRVLGLLCDDLGILIMVRAHFALVLGIGPAAASLTKHQSTRILHAWTNVC